MVCICKSIATHVWPVYKARIADIWLEILRKHWEDWRADEIHMAFNSCWILWRKPRVTHGHPDFMGKWMLFHQVLKVQSHLEGLRIYIVPESILPLGLTTFFPSWYLSPLMAEECRQYNDPAVAKIYTPRWTGVCLISFEVLLSVIGELAFSQMLKFWMSFNDFVYIIVVFIF